MRDNLQPLDKGQPLQQLQVRDEDSHCPSVNYLDIIFIKKSLNQWVLTSSRIRFLDTSNKILPMPSKERCHKIRYSSIKDKGPQETNLPTMKVLSLKIYG